MRPLLPRTAAQCRAAGERYDRYASRHPEMLAADRVQLNMLEHMPPFLVLLWLQSLLVSPQSAAVLGGIYLLLRASYPVFLGSTLKRDIPRRLLLNTFAGYAVLTIFAGWQVASLLG